MRMAFYTTANSMVRTSATNVVGCERRLANPLVKTSRNCNRNSLVQLGSIVLAACVLFGTCVPEAAAQEVQFSGNDADTARLVVKLVETRHLERQAVDDEVSSNMFDEFIKAWDANRLYFLQADISEFENSRHLLDDQLRSGQLQFASVVFARFVQRSDSMLPVIDAAIDAVHDFEADESIVKDAATQPWAASETELHERWRKTIKFQLLNQKLDGESDAQARVTLRQRYQSNTNLLKQTDKDEVLELFLSSFLRSFDPHSRYFSPTSEAEFNMAMSLKLTGIGARLRHELGSTVVEEVIKGGAAGSDGRLESGDVIVGIGQGADGKINDVVGLKLQHVVDQIRGEEGAVVRLKVQKKTGGDPVEYSLTRQVIQLEDQQVSGMVIDGATVQNGSTQRIGVLTIPSFYRDFQQAATGRTFRSTAQDVKAVLKNFEQQKIDALVVDMRDNTGGALAEAVEVTGLFIPTGPVVQMKARDTKPEVLSDDDKDWAWRGPMVVVCDRMTASASEIVAAAIKDYRRGIVVGDSATHGKGSVQNIVNLQARTFGGIDRGSLKLTVGTWHGISGNSNQQTGVQSDITLPSIADADELGEASLPHALPNLKTTRLSYLPFQNFVNDDILALLRQQNADRVSTSEHFVETLKRIDFVKQRNSSTEVSLNFKVQQQQRATAKALMSVEPSADDANVGDEQRFANDDYNREVLQITLDYLNLLKKSA